MLCRAKLKPVVKSSASLEWVSTQPSWWLIKWRCSHSPQSQGAQATTGLQMGKAAEWDGVGGLCPDQAWTESCAKQDRACVMFYDQAYWFRSCSDYIRQQSVAQCARVKNRGTDLLCRADVLWTNRVPASPVPSLLAGNHFSSAPGWRDKFNLFGVVFPWVFA